MGDVAPDVAVAFKKEGTVAVGVGQFAIEPGIDLWRIVDLFGLIEVEAAGGAARLQVADGFEAAVEVHFERGAVAGELAELCGGFGFGQGIAADGLGQSRGQLAEAAEVPGGTGELAAGFAFHGSGGGDVGGQIGFEFAKSGAIFGGDDEDAGGEAVFGGVLRSTRFPGVRFRAGGVAGVGVVGKDLGVRSHGY